MGRAATAQVELHHTLCLCQGGEPLGAPLALVVRGLVANFDFHLVGFVWYALVYRVSSAAQGQSVPAPKVAHALGGEVF